MNILTGTSGFSYKEWKGNFYPADLPADGMLAWYAERLGTVEINNTFYRMPSEKVVTGWASQVPESFRFVLKASQRITHYKRLKDAGSELEYFLHVSSTLGERLGPTLFQLPPNFRKDLPRLVDFLALLPNRWRAAFEFRHASWFEDDVYEALNACGAALCAADSDDVPAPLVASAEFGYLRLRRPEYNDDQLTEWVDRVREQPWNEVYVFFKHEDAGAGPRLAERFLSIG